MKKTKGLLRLLSILTVVIGMLTIYHGILVMSNVENVKTSDINMLIILVMGSMILSVLTLYYKKRM